jgi:hypothetical protein
MKPLTIYETLHTKNNNRRAKSLSVARRRRWARAQRSVTWEAMTLFASTAAVLVPSLLQKRPELA